jgi:hypothetical protein
MLLDRREGIQKALREAWGRQQSIKKLEFERDHNLHLLELTRIHNVTVGAEDID